MTTDITFTDAEFSFTQGGVVFHVRTEVGGDQPTRVIVDELKPAELPLEPEGETE